MYRTSVGFVSQMMNMLKGVGLDAERLCRDVGLDEVQLVNPEGFVPRANVYRLMELAAQVSGDPGIGLRAGQYFLPGAFQLVGYTMMSSPNLKQAFESLVRFAPLLGDGFSVELLQEENGQRFWGVEHVDVGGARPRAFEDATMAGMLGFCRWLTGGSLPRLREIEFTYPRPPDITEHQQLFDCHLCFGSCRTSILFDQQALLMPLSTANEALPLLHSRFAEYRVDQLRGITYRARVHGLLVERLSVGVCDIESVAMGLRVGRRTLQRGLAREGVQFSEVLDSVRRQLAEFYLRNCPYSLARVTELLGFKEPSSFHKASLRWFGMPPGRYRTQLAADENLPAAFPGEGIRGSDSAHEANDQRVDDIDEETADQGNDDERLVRRAVPLGDRGHVDDGRGGGAQGDSAEAGGDHAGFVVAAHAAEHQQHGIEDRQQYLQRQDGENENQHTAQLP
jgi:AraC-like DNA-binding protein